MPAKITLEVDGVTQFNRIFQRIGDNLSDWSAIWDIVRDAFWEIETDQFQSEGAKGASGRWEPLSPAYEKQKIARYGSFALIAGVLYATGELYRSMTGKGSNSIYQKSPMEMVAGTSLPYAAFHQRGGGRLPKREIISFSEQHKRKFAEIVQKGLVREVRKSGVYVDTTGDVAAPYGSDTSI